MRNNTAIRPLPFGTKMKVTKKENYKNLLEANDNNELETMFWDKGLSDLEDKYGLVYRPGKTIFQIYYQHGKNDSANKSILNEISQRVEKISNDWIELDKTYSSFIEYRDDQVKDILKDASSKLNDLEIEKNNFLKSKTQPINVEDPEIGEYLKKYSENREKIQKDFAEHPIVTKLNKENENHLKDREKLLNDYVKGNKLTYEELKAKSTYRNYEYNNR